VDVPRQILEIVPPVRRSELVAPWFSSTGWGTLTQTAKGISVACEAGTLSLRTIVTALKGKPLKATLAGGKLACKTVNVDGRNAAVFGALVTLGQGQTLKLDS